MFVCMDYLVTTLEQLMLVFSVILWLCLLEKLKIPLQYGHVFNQVSFLITYKHHGVILTKKKKTYRNECDLLNECKIKNKLVLGLCD